MGRKTAAELIVPTRAPLRLATVSNTFLSLASFASAALCACLSFSILASYSSSNSIRFLFFPALPVEVASEARSEASAEARGVKEEPKGDDEMLKIDFGGARSLFGLDESRTTTSTLDVATASSGQDESFHLTCTLLSGSRATIKAW